MSTSDTAQDGQPLQSGKGISGSSGSDEGGSKYGSGGGGSGDPKPGQDHGPGGKGNKKD